MAVPGLMMTALNAAAAHGENQQPGSSHSPRPQQPISRGAAALDRTGAHTEPAWRSELPGRPPKGQALGLVGGAQPVSRGPSCPAAPPDQPVGGGRVGAWGCPPEAGRSVEKESPPRPVGLAAISGARLSDVAPWCVPAHGAVSLPALCNELPRISLRALADTRQTGKLSKDQFALAMYFIQQKVSKGIDPPQALSPDMVPPSERGTPVLVSSPPRHAAALPASHRQVAPALYGISPGWGLARRD